MIVEISMIQSRIALLLQLIFLIGYNAKPNFVSIAKLCHKLIGIICNYMPFELLLSIILDLPK